MKTIEVDEELYRYIASHTLRIGESASDILRRLLKAGMENKTVSDAAAPPEPVTHPAAPVSRRQDRVRAMRELLLSDEYAEQRRAVSRFMLILTTLHALDGDGFAAATEALHGRTRVYFASDRNTLLQSGSHTKPKQVPGTPYWVITNTNSGRKRAMIEHIMQAMQFPPELIEKVCGTI